MMLSGAGFGLPEWMLEIDFVDWRGKKYTTDIWLKLVLKKNVIGNMF